LLPTYVIAQYDSVDSALNYRISAKCYSDKQLSTYYLK
jgi:hypothetical protein